MKYELAEKANQDRKIYAQLKELNVNDFIDSIIEEEKINERTPQYFLTFKVKNKNT